MARRQGLAREGLTMKYGISAAVVIAALLASVPLAAQDKIPPMPEGDSRVFIDGSTISSDGFTIRTPYNFGQTQREVDDIFGLAKWGCDLYGRVAVDISWNASSIECDQMGQAYAERDPTCEHWYHFACAIKR